MDVSWWIHNVTVFVDYIYPWSCYDLSLIFVHHNEIYNLTVELFVLMLPLNHHYNFLVIVQRPRIYTMKLVPISIHEDFGNFRNSRVPLLMLGQCINLSHSIIPSIHWIRCHKQTRRKNIIGTSLISLVFVANRSMSYETTIFYH